MVALFHGLPVQVAAAHVRDAQEVPVQPSPATRYPIQVPPDQLVAAALRGAQVAGFSGPQTLLLPLRGHRFCPAT